MERKQRTYTIDSIPPTPQEAAASLDPLVQPINDQNSTPVYIRRQSSVFFVAASTINENNKEDADETNTSIIRKCFACVERFSGIFYSLFASLLFTCSNFTIKQLNINILDFLVIRVLAQALISFGFIMYKGYRPFPDSHVLLVFTRSIFAAGGSISFYIGLSILPLPDLTTIRYTQVVWTALLALVIFRERITYSTIIASILTLIGVVCVAQPTFLFSRSKAFNETVSEILTQNEHNRVFGMFVAVGCALSISISIVLNKKLIQKNVRQSIIMLYFLLISLIGSIIIQIYSWQFSKSNTRKFNFKTIVLTKDFMLASIIATLQLFPMVLAQKSIKREHPSIVTVVQSSDILFAIILQNVFSSIKTDLLGLIGSVLVLTSIFIVGGHKLWVDRQSRTCMPKSPEETALKVESKN